MNWTTAIQKALDYIEEHLTEELDFETIAKQAYSSSFHFQRVFSMLCGFTLGDYIRMRRLTLSAYELTNSKSKIIDVALKYGYDTPESFSRAFVRFHGITPSEAKLGGKFKSFSRLFVKLTLSGGTTMDYRIEKKDKIKIICKKTEVEKVKNGTATKDISSFWADCNKDGTTSKLCKYIPNEPQFKGIIGICFTGEKQDSNFPYAIGAEYNGLENQDDFEIVELPQTTYAIFPCKGKMPDAFVNTYKQICTEFFTQSDYEYNNLEIEVYPSANVQDENYYCEIWIAVK